MTEEFAEIPDLTDVDLRKVFADGGTNLDACMRRLLDGIDDPDGVISAFQSFASSD
jgi:uncharacterized protein YegL